MVKTGNWIQSVKGSNLLRSESFARGITPRVVPAVNIVTACNTAKSIAKIIKPRPHSMRIKAQPTARRASTKIFPPIHPTTIFPSTTVHPRVESLKVGM